MRGILADLRSQKRSAAPRHGIKVAGVTQGNRQAVVAKLRDGELVMFLPEPENNYDTNAVAIKRMLDGAHLGYLPRTDQHIYTKGQIQFGRISDCGGFTPRRSYSDYDEYSSQEEFLFFARVSFQPSLPHLHVAAVPFHLQPKFRDFMRHFSATVDKFVAERPWVRADARCVFSGATDIPLSVVPIWLEDPKHRSIILEGVGWMATALAEAQEKLLLEPRSAAAEAAFQTANSWTPGETALYRQHQKNLQAKRDGERSPMWTLNLEIMDQYF